MVASANGAGGRPRVVILGGGFGGVSAARALRRAPVDVTLIDRRNHHLFQPLLYQVATAALSAPNVSAPLRSIFRKQANVTTLMDEVVGVDVAAREVELAHRRIGYDYLVVATGAEVSYLGNDGWRAHAPGLKSVPDALEIRDRFLRAFELAERDACARESAATLTFVIVGGGPTGVELAGTMSEIARRSIPDDFRHVDTRTARIILVDANDRLLRAFGERAGERAARDLSEMGVELRMGALVREVRDRCVVLEGGEEIEADNTFWAAGVRGSGVGGMLGVEVGKDGRVGVNDDLSVGDRREVFVIGDLARKRDPETGAEVPGLAPAAMQMGRYVAGLIERESRGRGGARAPFRYTDKGRLATIGRNRAVGTVRGVHVSGFPAWLLWLAVHLLFLVGFRNRVMVMLQWGWSYVTFRRGAQLIVGSAGGGVGVDGEGGAAKTPAREGAGAGC